jgi:hypothetical protein
MSLAVGNVVERDDGQRFALRGIDADGQWIGENLTTFGAPVRLTSAELVERFAVGDPTSPSLDETALMVEQDQQRTREAIDAYATAHAGRRVARRDPPEGSPEHYFESLPVESDVVEAAAQAIYSDKARLAGFISGDRVHPAVARSLNAMIAAEAKPTRRRRSAGKA